MSNTTRIDVVCSRSDSQGLKDYIKILNSYIEQGYRFHESELFADLPRFRTGFPKLTMIIPGSEAPDEAQSEQIEEPVGLSWLGDKDRIQGFIDALTEASTKVETTALAEEIGLTIPEDKKHPAAQRSYLIGQLKGYL